jgi:hypothetical protein
VAGGVGDLLFALLQRHPSSLDGVLFDLPSVLEAAQGSWGRGERARLVQQGRVRFSGGSFFEQLPAGDVYVLR